MNRIYLMLGIVLGLSGFSAFAQLESAVAPSAPSAGSQWKLQFAPEYYSWQEKVNGVKVLDESGPRYGLELSYKSQPDEEQEYDWIWATRFKVYAGVVDYNAQVQEGTNTVNVKSTTDYYGGLWELRGGYRWDLGEKHYLDFMGGIGVEDWLRKLNGPGGYDENWIPIYLKAGLEVSPQETETGGWIGTLGVKVPVYTTETVNNVAGLNFVTLHPGMMPSGYAEAGYQFTKNLSVVAFFDSYWFAKSSTATAVISKVEYQFYQPESQSYQVGVKVGWTF